MRTPFVFGHPYFFTEIIIFSVRKHRVITELVLILSACSQYILGLNQLCGFALNEIIDIVIVVRVIVVEMCFFPKRFITHYKLETFPCLGLKSKSCVNGNCLKNLR